MGEMKREESFSESLLYFAGFANLEARPICKLGSCNGCIRIELVMKHLKFVQDCDCQSDHEDPEIATKSGKEGKRRSFGIRISKPPRCSECGKEWKEVVEED